MKWKERLDAAAFVWLAIVCVIAWATTVVVASTWVSWFLWNHPWWLAFAIPVAITVWACWRIYSADRRAVFGGASHD